MFILLPLWFCLEEQYYVVESRMTEFKYEFPYNPDELFSSRFLVLKKIRVGEGEACS